MIDEGRNPMGAMLVSRESNCTTGGGNPGAPTVGTACDPAVEAREGRVRISFGNDDHRLRQEASEGKKPKGVSGGEAWLNSKTPDGTLGDVPSPEGEGQQLWWPNLRREAAFERAYGIAQRSKTSKGETP
jgi:hypothetical protein